MYIFRTRITAENILSFLAGSLLALILCNIFGTPRLMWVSQQNPPVQQQGK